MLKPTEIAAWVGAITGPGALLWDFYKWKTAGPKLTVNASPGAKILQNPEEGATYIVTHVRNVGTSATTVTTMAMVTYGSWLARVRLKRIKSFVVLKPIGGSLPHKLNVGEQWTGLVDRTAELDALLADGNLWCEIYHSCATRPVLARIRRADTKPADQDRIQVGWDRE